MVFEAVAKAGEARPGGKAARIVYASSSGCVACQESRTASAQANPSHRNLISADVSQRLLVITGSRRRREPTVLRCRVQDVGVRPVRKVPLLRRKDRRGAARQ